MKIKFLSLPHPVLGISDDIRGEFSVDFAFKPSKDQQILVFKMHLNNSTIEDLISQRKGAYVMEISCSATLFRESLFSFKKEFAYKIPTGKLLNRVVVRCYIVTSADNILRYQNNSANLDYVGFNFDLNKSDLLAVYDKRFEFSAEKQYEKYHGISSFMQVDEGDFERGNMIFRTTTNKLHIELSKEDYKRYDEFRKNRGFASYLHSSLAFPGLIFALSKMFFSPNEDKDTAWYQRLEQLIREKNLNFKKLEDILKISQEILGLPFSRSLKDLQIKKFEDEL